MKLSTIFRRVERLLADKTRWRKGDYIGKVGRKNCYCILGAMNRAAGLPVDHYDGHEGSRSLLKGIVEKQESASFPDLWTWNDKPERTFGDIRRAVKKAIRAAERAEAA